MARDKDIPQVWKVGTSGGGSGIGIRYLRDMTPTELAERDARQKSYEAMLTRQKAYEEKISARPTPQEVARRGCVFAKSCNLPDAIIDYSSPAIPTDSVNDYGDLVVLAGRDADGNGWVPLKRVSGVFGPNMGSLSLGGPTIATATRAAAAAGIQAAKVAGSAIKEASSGVVASSMVGILSILTPTNEGDSALYTEEQLQSLKQARSRVRLRIDEQPDGSLKGYGFYTGMNRAWEMVNVVQFKPRGSQQVADFGDGVELIWTPAVDTGGTLGIPALEAAPQAPHIWIYPPTEAADNIIVDPIYPPEFKDFILVFPPCSGIKPLYVVLSTQLEKNKRNGKAFEEETFADYSEDKAESVREVTLKTNSGTRTRLDMIGRDADGKVSCVECKSSETAPLTKNQKKAFPEIEVSGGTIVGKGKPGFPGGTRIPPTRVEIVRSKPTP